MADRKDRLKALIDQSPHDPFPRYGLAMEYKGTGDEKEAARTFQELLKTVPEYLPAYYQLATSLQALGESSEALQVLRRGIALAVESGDSHTREELEALLEDLD